MGPFDTERLHLRRMQQDDIPVLRELIYRDRNVWGSYSSIGDRPEELARSFQHHCSQSPTATFGRLVIVLRATGSPIGQVHLDPYVNTYYALPDEPTSPLGSLEVELAFAIGAAYWRQGYGTEACRRMIAYAFDDLRLPRLLGGALAKNAASVALQRRLGFRLERNAHPAYPEDWVSVLEHPLRRAATRTG